MTVRRSALLALLTLTACGSSGVTIVDGSGGTPDAPRSFAACDATSDFQNARQLPGLDDAMLGRSHLSNYYIEASLTDDERNVYFAACAEEQRPACEIYRAHLDDRGNVDSTNYVDTGARSPRHPSISADGRTIVWSEEYGRGSLLFLAEGDAATFGPDLFTNGREALHLPEGSNVRYADPYIARDNRLYAVFGPSSGTSTVYSTPIATDAALMVDAKLTGLSPVIDGANRVYLGRYDSNTGLRKIVTSERAAGSAPFSEPTDRYVKGLNLPGTSNYPNWISKDGCRLYFTRGTQESVATYRIWLAERKAKP